MKTICLKTKAQIESDLWRRLPPCECDNCREYRAGTLWEQTHTRTVNSSESWRDGKAHQIGEG